MEHFNAKEDKSLSKINGKALQLKTGGGLTLGDQEILKNNHRLEFIWGEHNENSTAQETSVTTWRQARARRAYTMTSVHHPFTKLKKANEIQLIVVYY